jgi:uncharacterized phage-associated protein
MGPVICDRTASYTDAMEASDVSRVDDVAAAFVGKLGPIDAMKLQKLLYYAQGWHLAITGRPLFADRIEAWRDGPVVPAVYARHRGWRAVASWPGDPMSLDEEAMQLLDLVCASYGELSGDDLSKLTHSEEPWLRARHGLSEGEWSSDLISYDAMRSYFTGRELVGHTSADLAAGGLVLEAPGAVDEFFPKILEEIRSGFHGEPAEHPGDDSGSNGRARAGVGVPHEVEVLVAKRRARRGIS